MAARNPLSTRDGDTGRCLTSVGDRPRVVGGGVSSRLLLDCSEGEVVRPFFCIAGEAGRERPGGGDDRGCDNSKRLERVSGESFSAGEPVGVVLFDERDVESRPRAAFVVSGSATTDATSASAYSSFRRCLFARSASFTISKSSFSKSK